MRLKGNQGFSLLEIMAATLMLSVIATAGSILFISGQSAWIVTDTEIQLQENSRQILLRASMELQESGTDKDGVLQVNILNNSGVNGSDILQFSVPICACGTSVVDENADVKSWGAPLTWGQAGCSSDYVVGQNNKVEICHLPPGNPENKHTINGSINSVRAHLAHGDWIGACDACDPYNYTNRTIEYILNTEGQMLRRVLDSDGAVVNSVIFANNLSNFQVSINGDQTVVTIAVDLLKNTLKNRTITKSANIEVFLRN